MCVLVYLRDVVLLHISCDESSTTTQIMEMKQKYEKHHITPTIYRLLFAGGFKQENKQTQVR